MKSMKVEGHKKKIAADKKEIREVQIKDPISQF